MRYIKSPGYMKFPTCKSSYPFLGFLFWPPCAPDTFASSSMFVMSMWRVFGKWAFLEKKKMLIPIRSNFELKIADFELAKPGTRYSMTSSESLTSTIKIAFPDNFSSRAWSVGFQNFLSSTPKSQPISLFEWIFARYRTHSHNLILHR